MHVPSAVSEKNTVVFIQLELSFLLIKSVMQCYAVSVVAAEKLDEKIKAISLLIMLNFS